MEFEYVISLEEARQLEPFPVRIQGFWKMHQAGVPHANPLLIIKHKAFIEYKREKKIPKEVRKEIFKAVDLIKEENPRKGVAVRHAFHIPEKSRISAPRSSSVHDKGVVLSEVERMYEHVREFKGGKEGIKVNVMLHPFINPSIKEAGGQVFSTYSKKEGEKKYAIVEATFGNDESVQSCIHDIYLVDKQEEKVVKKDVPKKKKCVKALPYLQEYGVVPVPKGLREKQALTNQDILKVVGEARKYEKEFGPSVMEFDKMFEDIFFIQANEFKLKEGVERLFETRLYSSKEIREREGEITTIEKEGDLSKIKEDSIIYLKPEVIRNRDMDLVMQISNLEKRRVVIYPGRESTAHFILAIKEAGHPIIYAPRRRYKDGQEVKLKTTEKGYVSIEKL